jgi:hypothetical protein
MHRLDVGATYTYIMHPLDAGAIHVLIYKQCIHLMWVSYVLMYKQCIGTYVEWSCRTRASVRNNVCMFSVFSVLRVCVLYVACVILCVVYCARHVIMRVRCVTVVYRWRN